MYPVIVAGNEDGGKHVTCYCNLPSCVTTGYMCKSPLGGCFSHLLSDSRTRHGCIGGTGDDRDEKPTCMNSPSGSAVWAVSESKNAGAASASAGGSLVLCCYRDLCNHVDSPQSRIKLNDTIGGNWTGFNPGINLGPPPGIGTPGTTESNPAEVWFRVATIAVPICGALILFLLVALAIKLLTRTDAHDASNKLSATYIPHGSGHSHLEQPLMKKLSVSRDCSFGGSEQVSSPLLLSHSNIMHTCETSSVSPSQAKKADNLKINSDCDRKDESYVIMQHYPEAVPQQSSPLQKITNTNVRDVNINIPPEVDNNTAECANNKLYDKRFLPSSDKLYDKKTIVYWDQTGANAANHCPR